MFPTSRIPLVLVVALALAACGGDSEPVAVDPIEIDSTVPAADDPIDLDRAIDPDTGAFVAEEWPSACALVSDATLQSIFPQTEDIGRRVEPSQLTFLSFVPGSGGPIEVTVPEATCTTSVGFPQEGLRAEDGNVVVQVTSSIAIAGDEELVERNAEAHTSGDPTDVGGGACTVVPPGSYNCDVGRMIFSIHIDMRQTAQYTGSDGSSYVVDGEAFTFQGSDPEWDSIIHDKVLAPIVEAAVARSTDET